MGYFAILHPKSNEQSFQLERCHTNLFVLPHWGFHEFFWDVGLLLSAKPEATDATLEIALPFATGDGEFEDLSSKVLDQAIATQIFGERVLIDQTTVTIPSYGEPFRVVAVSKEAAVRIEDSGEAALSLWRISVSLSSQRRSYLRLRFRIRHLDAFWQWQPSVLLRDGAILDMRVSDVRGAANEKSVHLSERIAEIPYLNAFVIAPVRFRLLSNHPKVKYIRLIEPRVWERYLNRRLRGRLAVFHWKDKHEDSPISADRPFLGFLEFGPATRRLAPIDLVRLMVATTLVILLAFTLAGVQVPGTTQLREATAGAYGWLVGTAWLAASAFVVRAQALLAAVGVARTVGIWWRRWSARRGR